MSVIPTRDRTPQIARTTPGSRVRPRTAVPGAAPAATPVVATVARPQEGGLSGRDVLRIVRKRKWIIILSLAICFGMSILVTYLWRRHAPFYTATAVLQVRTPETTILRAERGVVPIAWIDSLTATYVSQIKTHDVLQAATSTERVRNTQWLQNSPDDAIERLAEDLSVSPRVGSPLITASMTGMNKTELPEIVNAVVDAAQARSREQASGSKQAQVRQLTSEQASLVETRDRRRAEKAALVRDSEVPDLLERTNVLTIKLHTLSPQVTEYVRELAQADRQIELIKEQDKSGAIRTLPAVLQALDYDPALRQLRAMMLARLAEKENLEQRFGPKHRSVQSYLARQKSLEAQVVGREQILRDGQVSSMVANAEARKAIILEGLTKLREELRLVDISVRGLRATHNAYVLLEAQDQSLTEQINRIDDRLVDLRMLLKADPPLDIFQRAVIPREPSWPTWPVMLPLGALLGLVIGFGLSFLLEFVDTSIKGPSDIARRVDLPLLGMVPHVDDLEENIRDLRLAFSTHPNSLVSEAFRQVRTCLLFSGPVSQRKSLLITSPLPEDGRTTVTLNLAAAIARGGRKVLVVDANFRQPAIRKLFPACPEGGLSSALVGQAAWRDMVQELEPNLNVMSSGPLPPNPGELLGSEQMNTVLGEMVADYDQILFDAAPCLLVTDAAALSTLVDGVVLVVRAGANTSGIVQRTRETLTRIGAHVVGVVLNGVRTVAGGYLRKNYEAFYDYHERAKPPQDQGKVGASSIAERE